MAAGFRQRWRGIVSGSTRRSFALAYWISEQRSHSCVSAARRCRQPCREAAQGDVVQAANFNSPGQVVIAGAAAAVDRAIELLKTKGAKRAIKLPVSVPSHSALMQPAADEFAKRLETIEFRPGDVRDIYTVDVRKHGESADIRRALVEQLVKPVRWTQTIQAIVASGVRTVVECGPGRVLTGLNRRIEKNKEIEMLAIEDAESLQRALQACGSVA
jgi:[acyl-carrier-protein] S-malonyltransferase